MQNRETQVLCTYCLGIPEQFFIQNESHYAHQPSLAALEASGDNGCAMCKSLAWCLTLRVKHPNLFSEHVIEVRRRYDFELPGSTIELHSEISSEGCFVHIKCPNRAEHPGYNSVPVLEFYPPFDDVYDGKSTSQGNRMRENFAHLPKSKPRQDLKSVTNGSHKVTSMVRAWIDNCDRYHHLCRKHSLLSNFCPTRLIDVRPRNGSEDPRLILSRTLKGTVPYITLSHCWGSNVAEWANMKTTQKNISERQKFIPFDSLPKSFRDAISLTRDLGERFLWIDALCIIQDSQEDWEIEAAMMNQVYSGSLCTITASAAVSATEGIFTNRSEVPNSLILPEKGSLWPEGLSVHPILPEYFPLLESEKLHSRGWCLQERQLSPRIVYYTAYQVLWECRDSFKASEVYPSGFDFPSLERDYYLGNPPKTPGHLLYFIRSGITTQEVYSPLEKTGPGPPYYVYFELPGSTTAECHNLFKGRYLAREPKNDSIRNWYGQYHKEADIAGTLRAVMVDDYCSWNRLVEEVSLKQFTVSSDLLPAIAGLARKIQLEKQSCYAAGLWQEDFLRGLWWGTWHDPELQEPRRPHEYRAPSWSWASVDGPVKFFFGGTPVLRRKTQHVYRGAATLEILDVNVTPWTTLSPLGRVRSGSLTVRGLLKLAAPVGDLEDANGDGLVRSLKPVFSEATLEDSDDSIVLFDFKEDAGLDGNIYCLCISVAARKPMDGNESPARHVYGLALVPTEARVGQYKRIGQIWTTLQFWGTDPAMEKLQITIV